MFFILPQPPEEKKEEKKKSQPVRNVWHKKCYPPPHYGGMARSPSPRHNSDPGSPGRLFSPVPATIYAFIFIERRVQHFLPSSACIEFQSSKYPIQKLTCQKYPKLIHRTLLDPCYDRRSSFWLETFYELTPAAIDVALLELQKKNWMIGLLNPLQPPNRRNFVLYFLLL